MANLHKPKSPYNCFQGQKSDEKVLLYIRKHWIVDLIIIFKTVVVSGVPIALFFVLKHYQEIIIDEIWWSIMYLILHFYIMIVFAWYFVDWLDIHLDLIIVTNERLVDINQTRIFNRKIAETSLGQIQDVSGEVKGFLGFMLNYGFLKILTASADNDVFEMKYVHNVSAITGEILEIRDQYLDDNRALNGSSVGECG